MGALEESFAFRSSAMSIVILAAILTGRFLTFNRAAWYDADQLDRFCCGAFNLPFASCELAAGRIRSS
jgi:hypothetical protein